MKERKTTAMFHIALDKSGALQPVICASIPFGDMALLQMLLSTDRVGGRPIDFDDKVGYLFTYDNNLSRPYPSVIIWHYEIRGDKAVVVDVTQEDIRAIDYALKNLLTPEVK